MTDKELREIKRRWRADKSNVSRIVGCFVNSSGQILSRINQSLTLGESDLNERLLTVMRKALSGSIGVALSELDFSTRSVESGEEHALLMRLRDSELRDSDALERF